MLYSNIHLHDEPTYTTSESYCAAKSKKKPADEAVMPLIPQEKGTHNLRESECTKKKGGTTELIAGMIDDQG